MKKAKYTKEYLCALVARNKSFASVLKEAGIKQSGGMQSHIRKLVRKYEIDTSHFLGQAWSRGRRVPRRKAQDVLVIGKIEHGNILHRFLIEIGRPDVCAECQVGTNWQGKTLVLEVHHENGNREDNRPENLTLLCPNCHSQTKNYGIRNRAPLAESADAQHLECCALVA